MKTLAILALVFILASCEKEVEYLDAPIPADECKMIYELTNFSPGDAGMFYLYDYQDTIRIENRYKSFSDLPQTLKKGHGYILLAMFEITPSHFSNKAQTCFDIDDNDKEKIIRLTRKQ